MASFNKTILLGNLTRDPELKYTPRGTAVCQIGLAVNRVYSNDQGEKMEEVTFIDVETFGRTAELVNEYLRKGSSCLVEGRLKLDVWDDKQTGKKRSKLKVIGELVQFLDSKGGKPSGQADNPPPRPPAHRPPQNAQDPDLDQPDVPF